MRRTTLTIIISTVLAVFASLVVPPRAGDLYFDLEVAAKFPTSIKIYFDTGLGFNQQQSSSRKLPGRSEPWMLRFKLPGEIVKRIRLDFDEQAEEVVVSKARFWCPQTGNHTLLTLEAIKAYRDVDPVAVAEESIRIVSAGPDPQLVLSTEKLYVSIFDVRLAILLVFLFYPFSLVIMRLTCCCCNRILPLKRLDEHCADNRESPPLHYVVLSVTFIVAFLASIHFLEKNSREGASLIEGLAHEVQHYDGAFGFTEAEIIRPDGLRISTRLYNPDSQATGQPAFLLLHGNYPDGQSHPLYKVLANELAKSGLVVMTIDLAGYGASEDPFIKGSETDLSFESETAAALEYLESQPFVDPDRIGIIGHSMGADPALRVGLASPTVATITLIGPPRRVQERFYSPEDTGFFWHWANKVRKERYGEDRFPDWYSKERWRDDIISRDMLHMLPALSQTVHKPVLFIDGERESQADKEFLADYVQRCSLPRKHITMGKTDHDCNVGVKDNQIYFDPAVMEELAKTITRWHTMERRRLDKARNYFFNLLELLFSPPSVTIC